MLCLFKKIENGIQCECCGYAVGGVQGEVKRNCDGVCGEYPSLPSMVWNFGKAMIEYAKDGFKNVSDEEQERRMSICHSCPLNHYDKEQNRCRACGCNSTLSTRIASYDCPHGLWKESS